MLTDGIELRAGVKGTIFEFQKYFKTSHIKKIKAPPNVLDSNLLCS